jgi:hypothetical protein
VLGSVAGVRLLDPKSDPVTGRGEAFAGGERGTGGCRTGDGVALTTELAATITGCCVAAGTVGDGANGFSHISCSGIPRGINPGAMSGLSM